MNISREKDQMKTAIESDPIHRILASEEPIVPSSGFLSAVMECVENEWRAPAPIPFPWKRALPGFVLAGGVFGWGGYKFIHMCILAVREIAAAPAQLTAAALGPIEQVAWVGMALVVSLLSWMLSRRIVGLS
jgi:hypothetical protein